jgi:hypothetical protein
MRVSYSAYVGGDVTIPDEELKGKTSNERNAIIGDYVAAAANEDVDGNLEWEIDE